MPMANLSISSTSVARRCTSAACTACRKRKVKCNNAQPRCSNCTMYDSTCTTAHGRRRRKRVQPPTELFRILPTTHTAADQAFDVHHAQGQSIDATSSTSVLSASSTREDSCIPELHVDCGKWGHVTGQARRNDSTLSGSSLSNSRLDFWVNLVDGPGFQADHATNHGRGEEQERGPAVSSPESATGHDWYMKAAEEQTLSLVPTSGHANSTDAETATEFDQPTRLGSSLAISDVRDLGPESFSGDPQSITTEACARLSDRNGSFQIAEDGERRYFGATSNLHLLHNGPFSSFRPEIQTVRSYGEVALRTANLEWRVDPDYVNDLLQLYFTWENPLLNVVERSTFIRERLENHGGKLSTLSSSTLENAMLTSGARYSSRSYPTIEGDASEYFASRTRTLLQIEMDSPTLATVQALIILSGHEAAAGHDSRGWLYSGMALRISKDLGLNLDHTANGVPQEIDDDAKIGRKNVHRATFCADTLWSSWCGRSPSMDPISIEPYGLAPTKNQEWQSEAANVTQVKPRQNSATDPVDNIHVYFSRLMAVLHDILNTMYSPSSKPDSFLRSFISRKLTELQEWRLSLPESLLVGPNDEGGRMFAPAVLELHMQYHEIVIILHRPLMLETENADSTVVSQCSPEHLGPKACTASAIEICRLLKTFRQRFGLAYIHVNSVHILMTASLILAHNSCHSKATFGRDEQEHMITSLQMLSELSKTYKSSVRALEVVASLRREWQTQASRYLTQKHANEAETRCPVRIES